MKLLGDDAEVSIFPHDNQLAFSFGEVFFTSRLIDDKFPEIRGIIPQEKNTKCVIDSGLLEQSVQRASLVVDSDTQAVELHINDEEMQIKASSNVGVMEEKVNLKEQQGENTSITLNAKFLMDILKVTEEEYLEINFSPEKGPCIIRPENEDDYVYLVLPIKIEE